MRIRSTVFPVVFTTILFLWIIFQTFYFGSFGPDLGIIKEIRPHRVLYILTVVSFLSLLVRRRAAIRKLEIQDYLMLLVTLSCTISFIVSGAHYDQTVGKNKWLSALFNITYYPLTAYLCVRALPYRPQMLISVLKLLCAIGVYLSITGFCEHYELRNFVWPDYIMDESLGTQFGRARGPFMESVAMGRVLTMALGAFLIMSTRLRGVKALWNNTFIFLSLGAVYFTYTRGPWIGAGCLLLAFFIFRTPVRRMVKMLCLGIALAALTGLSSKFSVSGPTLFERRQSTVSDRVVTWIVSAKMIEDKPLHGIGFGRFNLEWEKYFQRTHSKIEFQGFDGSHNTFLTMGAEVGVPTLLVFLLMMYYQVRMCAGVYKRLGEDRELERSFVVMVMGLAVMYVFTGWFSDLRWNTVQNTLMFICFALVCGLKHHLEEQDLSPAAAEAADVVPVEEPARMSYTASDVGYGGF